MPQYIHLNAPMRQSLRKNEFMTEDVWLMSSDTCKLIDWLSFDALASDRKFRLFSVECSRPIIPHMRQFKDASAHVLVLTEAFADGKTPANNFNRPSHELLNHWREFKERCLSTQWDQGEELSEDDLRLFTAGDFGVNAIVGGTLCAEECELGDNHYRQRKFYTSWYTRAFPLVVAAEAISSLVEIGDWKDEARIEAIASQRHLLHEIFGNPFHPVDFNPAWRTDNTVSIATKMYNERNFDAMPILADALEDARCDNLDILKHCRESGVHVRGCWVVDLVLGKE
jgi:hypothetical protein